MKNLLSSILLIGLLFFYNDTFAQTTNTNVVAKIKIETTDNASKIIGVGSNTTDVYYNLRYVISVIRPIPNTKRSNKDSFEERFTLGPAETKELAHTSIVVEEGQKVIVLLLIYNEDDKLVGKDRYVFNDDEAKKEIEKPLPNDGIELSGIVTDQTKTKLGKDFFDYFYFYYTFNNLKGEKVITIDEIVSFRRTTRIQVKADSDVIFEFLTQPNDEFIENNAKTAIQRVYRYFQNLKKENAYITQY